MIWPVTDRSQRAAISKMWQIFPVAPGEPIHLRAIWPKGVPGRCKAQNATFTASRYPNVADRQQAFERVALELNGLGYNVYTVLNRIDPSFEGNEHNHLAVNDEHIVRRRYLLIDIDRAETRQPISDDEIEDILEVVGQVENHLNKAYGYKRLTVFSGNGCHIYFPIDLPNTPEAKELCRDLLRRMARKFDTATVKIDTTVYNASRITKVPGTVARKGLETEERPYRMAEVVE